MSRKSELYFISEMYAQVREGMQVQPEGDASAINMGPGGVIEVQPDGQYPDAPAKDENAEQHMAPGSGEDWRTKMTYDIIDKGNEFLRSVYKLGYTGEAGDSDINEIVALLAQEVEADDRLKQALDAVVGHMVAAGHADM